MTAALDVRGHLNEAIIKNEAAHNALGFLVLEGIANGDDTRDLTAVLHLLDDVHVHVHVASEWVTA